MQETMASIMILFQVQVVTDQVLSWKYCDLALRNHTKTIKIYEEVF